MDLNFHGRLIGPGHPCYVIAEAGVNHNGSLELAFQLVDVAVAAGADAVKFQTYHTEAIVTPDAPQAAYQVQNTGKKESQFEMVKRLELNFDEHQQLADYCHKQGIQFLSTPFDQRSADWLEDLGVPGYKVPSGEVTNLPFLRYLARKGKPLILSTGMCGLGQVEQAVETLEEEGLEEFAILHCVSDYPANPQEVNLRALETLRHAFEKPIGYSDHTLGDEVTLAAVALGCCIIEKHITLDCTLPGPDHAASLDPPALTAMMRRLRIVESALGRSRKTPSAAELDTAKVARKSLVVVTDLPAGSVLTEEVLDTRRPGTGLPPSFQPFVLNRTVKRDLSAGSLLGLEDVA